MENNSGPTFEDVLSFFRSACTPIEEAVWHTTLRRMKYVCLLNGLTRKQSGRLVKKLAKGRMTATQVLDHLSRVRTR